MASPQLPAASPESGSSSGHANPNASDKEALVLGQPEPFNVHGVFKKGERIKYHRVTLPGALEENVKLWVRYDKLYLIGIEMKEEVFSSKPTRGGMKQHFYNHGPGASMYNGSFILTLSMMEKPSSGHGTTTTKNKSSEEAAALYTKVELPGVYGQGVKMWVKSGEVIVNSRDVKVEEVFCSREERKSREIDIGMGSECDPMVLIFAPKLDK
ncbi:hypothetical protein Tsubulata_043087 [Turnera subulata]|uniref:Uncharacterized protein n=1 Tax=Turnera subulata TaxID=218843 RepID=A0A9Q0GFU0_9ROSI|nr:hypothetical protein Tsubulata_043087 [Turnera subulata]